LLTTLMNPENRGENMGSQGKKEPGIDLTPNHRKKRRKQQTFRKLTVQTTEGKWNNWRKIKL